MDDYYMLSREDRDLIKQWLRSTLPPEPSNPFHYTSEVYVAKVPSGGIPALTPAAGTAAGEYDKPGFEVCDIYQISYASSGTEFELVPISGLSYPVLNLQESEIAESWILVVKEKGGQWIACVGSGGSTLHWGTLDADLKYGDTTGVTVSLDAGGGWTNVLPSKLLPEGKMWLTGSAVLVGIVDGEKYVIQGTCLDDVP